MCRLMQAVLLAFVFSEIVLLRLMHTQMLRPQLE